MSDANGCSLKYAKLHNAFTNKETDIYFYILFDI